MDDPAERAGPDPTDAEGTTAPYAETTDKTRPDPGRTRERILFRFIITPCCKHQLCWVNPRLPTHCPECGEQIYTRLKFEMGHILINDDQAWLEYQRR